MDLAQLSRHELDNGLRITLLPDDSLSLVAVNLWYHVGSKNERPRLTGFAHLFEHMLFQGSQNVSSNGHFEHVQRVGGVANGSTWYDRTNYYETLPSSALETGLWLESDRMGFLLPAMTSEKLENQRSVVMNERRQRVDNQPYGQASERLSELLYPADHPYHWPVIGYMEDIEAATLEDVTTFFETFYTPNNAALTLVGDFDPVHALERIRAYFGDIPRGPEIEPVQPGLPPARLSREVLEDQVQLPRIYLAYALDSFGTDEWYAANLLSQVLSQGRSSRLHHSLVYEQQLAQSASTFVSPTEACATFTLAATAKPEISAEEIEEAVVQELRRVIEDGVDEAELDRARNGLLLGHHGQLQSRERVADMLSAMVTYFDDPSRYAEATERYGAVTTDDVSDLARGRLDPDGGARVLVVPEAAA
ncbi:MAG: pitrilysin family protein [Acidobacteriota bacterium]